VVIQDEAESVPEHLNLILAAGPKNRHAIAVPGSRSASPPGSGLSDRKQDREGLTWKSNRAGLRLSRCRSGRFPGAPVPPRTRQGGEDEAHEQDGGVSSGDAV